VMAGPVVRLGKLATVISGQHVLADRVSAADGANGIPYLTGPSDFVGKTPVTTAKTTAGTAFCERGDLLITVKGSGVGSTAVADQSYAISRQLMAIRCAPELRSLVMAAVEMETERLRDRAAGLIPGLSRSQVVSLPIPALGKSAAGLAGRVLCALDSWIEDGRRLLEAKRGLKRALMQQVLNCVTRCSRIPGTWKRTALSELTKELSTRNCGGLGAERVMGVLKHEGLVPMRERTMAEDLSRYKVVPPRAFAYNPMRINIGSIAYSWHPHDVLVSPDYVVFSTRPNRLEPRYLDHLRRSEPWANFVKRAGNGSVRVRIYYQDLGQFVFPLPPLDEQRQIASLLDKADDEIALFERQISAYRQLKRGLMQKLLSGDIASMAESNIANPALSRRR